MTITYIIIKEPLQYNCKRAIISLQKGEYIFTTKGKYTHYKKAITLSLQKGHYSIITKGLVIYL